jgi:hypothetical protein
MEEGWEGWEGWRRDGRRIEEGWEEGYLQEKLIWFKYKAFQL